MLQKKKGAVKLIPFLIILAIGFTLWSIPAPEGLKENAWHLLAIFVTTIIGIMAKVLPMGGMALLALTTISVTDTLPLKDALSGFSNPIVWLIVLAFLVAKSFVKTGLGFRIAYHLVRWLGRSSLGLGYGMALTDLVLAPAVPSNSARGGGIVFPLIKSLALTYESSPEKNTEGRIGTFLVNIAYHSNIISSAMFLTAMAANPMMAEIAEGMGVNISWGTWALAASLPGAISILLIPWLIYNIYPPEIKETPEAPQMAKDRLKAMGKMSAKEWITSGVFFLMLFLWIFGGFYIIHFDDYFSIQDMELLKSDSTTTAMIGVAILIVTGVLSWEDVIEEKGAWNTLFWFAILVMMAGYLTQLGVISWMSDRIQDSVIGIPWVIAYLLLLLGFFYSHYFFASTTAHASSMYAAFAVVGVTAGVPPLMMTLSLAFTTNLSACLTHYGTGPGPIYYGSGYVDLPTWWKLGGIISVVHLIVWIGLGSFWWKLLGMW